MSATDLFSPGQIGTMYLKNRIVMAPLGSRLTSENGAVTEGMIDFYALRAKGGVGLIVLEAMGVDYPLAVGKPNHVRFHDDQYIPGHALLTERIHENGAKVLAMPWHTGINRGMFAGEMPVGPSALLNENTHLVPRELSTDEIGQIVEKFALAAKRSMLCGYDGVMIHGGHGYLISSFVSQETNKREDAYGGSLENRLRFPLEIVAAIRRHTGPHFPILFRINGCDFTQKGISVAEATQFAIALEKAGVAGLDVSAGVYSTMDRMIEPIQYAEGWKLYLAEAIKRHVSIPVIGVGVLQTPAFINQALAEERIDFAAMGRELLCEPNWVKKVQANDDHLLHCIGCNSCFERIGNNLPLRCAINPETGRESRGIPVAASKKKVAVVGGGPAGMTAAVYADKAGHQVDLFEKAPMLGGQLLLAGTPPGKERITRYLNWMIAELERRCVHTHFHTTFSTEMADGYDHIVLACGAKSKQLVIEGEQPLCSAWDLLADRTKAEERCKDQNIVIIGAGLVGCETALYTKAMGAKSVAIVEMQDCVAADMDRISRIKLMDELKENEIALYTACTVCEKTDTMVLLKTQDDAQDSSCQLACSLLITAVGVNSNNALAHQLFEKKCSFTLIGDASNVGKIGDAVHTGYNAGISI